MAWAYRSSSSAGGATGGSLTINKPSGVVDNDLLLISWYTEATNKVNTLSGWTKIGEVGPAGGNPVYCTTFYKRASSEPASYTWTWNNPSGWRTAVMSAFSGGITSDPFIDVSAGRAANAGEGGALANSITNTASNNIAIIGSSDYLGDGQAPGSSGYTEVIDFSEEAIYYKVYTSSGATGVITLTGGDTGGWATYHQSFFEDTGGGGTAVPVFYHHLQQQGIG